MRMLKIALVLVVLASFIVVMTAVSTAATVTPTMKPMATKMVTPTMKTAAAMPNKTATAMPNATMKAPTMGKATMMPTMPAAAKMPARTPGKMIDLSQMKSNIGDVYKMLKNTTKPKSVSSTGAGLAGMANQMMGGYMGKNKQGLVGVPGVPAPKTISQLSGMPQLGKMVKIA
jgi:hypothetical protein